MRIAKVILVAVGATLTAPLALAGDTPEEDRKETVEYFQQKFPDVPLEEFVNGQYALDEDRRKQWESMSDFPPFEFAVAEGQEMFETPFANGKTYASCFENDGIGVRQNYPYFDTEKKEVITLELAINRCREANGEEPLKWKKGPIASISAYMASTSAGKKFDIEVPNDDALAAYQAGKEFYYTRRGQLNFSCASCHVQNPGNWIRADLLSPMLGQVANFPVHRAKWGEMGTLHRRFTGCNRNVRAVPLEAQGEEYRNLEYFMTYLNNGLPVVGPATRP
ncbi:MULTISPECIES: sulfur oxidation c-type cytochrome SoxA [Marinobacter]|uniref:SoxAX cytochrome complex subunit A n=1 Tax=Marinobacter suaedae TaxID=3057675 RepID=A0ABT8W1X7_9GAMM|nr:MULTISPECIES: sulfur oxidation c-type cytochrome SoxA [unclassified Marinobacter]MBZ2168068.1 sulfur oxidation c-type cytochrome SoxA [Marinobacter sp. F4216]MDO3722186.1 sulfur oxidation c-type cytochrome SoxA [Marinobacter sp. chi1]